MGAYLIIGLVAYSKLDPYEIFTIFSHTFSVSLLSINKTKKKEHCSNFKPRGEGALIRDWALIRINTIIATCFPSKVGHSGPES